MGFRRASGSRRPTASSRATGLYRRGIRSRPGRDLLHLPFRPRPRRSPSPTAPRRGSSGARGRCSWSTMRTWSSRSGGPCSRPWATRSLPPRTAKRPSAYESRGSAIDLVLLDVVMPGLGGGEVFDRLKSINPDMKCLPCLRVQHRRRGHGDHPAGAATASSRSPSS